MAKKAMRDERLTLPELGSLLLTAVFLQIVSGGFLYAVWQIGKWVMR